MPVPVFEGYASAIASSVNAIFMGEYSQSVARPPGFVSETSCLVKACKLLVSLNNVEADTELQLSQTDRAEMHWAAVAFIEMV